MHPVTSLVTSCFTHLRTLRICLTPLTTPVAETVVRSRSIQTVITVIVSNERTRPNNTSPGLFRAALKSFVMRHELCAPFLLFLLFFRTGDQACLRRTRLAFEHETWSSGSLKPFRDPQFGLYTVRSVGSKVNLEVKSMRVSRTFLNPFPACTCQSNTQRFT